MRSDENGAPHELDIGLLDIKDGATGEITAVTREVESQRSIAADAEAALAELRAHRLLSGTNIEFLEVQLRAELGMWRQVLDLPNLDQLLLARRPRAVTEALIHSVYRCYLAQAEAEGDPSGACATFAFGSSRRLFGARLFRVRR